MFGGNKSAGIIFVIIAILSVLVISIVCSSFSSSMLAYYSSTVETKNETTDDSSTNDNNIGDNTSDSTDTNTDTNTDTDVGTDTGTDTDTDAGTGDNTDNSISDSRDPIVIGYDSANYASLLFNVKKEGSYSFDKTKVDNDLTSIKVKKGYTVDIFNDAKYKDKLLTATSDIKDLGNNKNKASSIIVRKL